MKVTHRPAARIAVAIAALTPAVTATVAAASAPAWQGRSTSHAVAGLMATRAEPAASTATAAGTRLWVALYQGSNGVSQATSVATSPHRSEVFVTGLNGDTSGHQAYGTVAYSARGARRWAASYNGPAGENFANELAVSPGGSKVFVTGYSQDASGTDDYATVAYSAATGARLWVARYTGPAGSTANIANALAVSPDGSKVFVTGFTEGAGGTEAAYATVAYAAATGARLWVARYTGPAGSTGNFANALAVSPDGSKVFVTGASFGSTGPSDYATVGYAARTGARLWVRRYHGPGTAASGASSVAVSPDGSKIFVTGAGSRTQGPLFSGYATLAYNAATGARIWLARYDGPSGGGARKVAVSPDGSKVFVTGNAANAAGVFYATVAYRT